MTGRILISPESTSQTTTVRGRTMTLTGPALDVAMILALLGVGALSFGPAFGGMRGYLTAGVGVAVGGAVAAVARWRGWGVLSTAGAVLIAYLALGGPLTIPETTIAGVVPTPTTLSQLGLLLARAWRDLLTVGIPADGFPGPAVVPLITGLVCGALAIGSAIRDVAAAPRWPRARCWCSPSCSASSPCPWRAGSPGVGVGAAGASGDG